jgi:phosphate transport system substrate-binding protein
VKLSRFAAVPTLLLAGSITLAACGSDNTKSGNDSPSKSAGNGDASQAATESGSTNDCATGQLQTDGSSAQKPAFNAWIQAYEAKCSGAQINYGGNGSGAGVTAFTQKQVPLAGSDSHLTPAQQGPADKVCAGGKAIDIPMVATPVAIVYNLKGVTGLTLTPSAIAQIFAGKVTKWNDPAIAASNKGVSLPATSITTIHRSKDSGTTDNFAKFLDAQAKSDWKYGTGQTWAAPGGTGAADSSAMVTQVKQADGAIGYVDSPDATKNKLNVAKLDVGQGPVALSPDTVNAGLSAAKVVTTGDDIQVNLNYGLKQKGAYPALLVTYEITCTKGLSADQAKFVKSFLTYTSTDGQSALTALGHFPLPDSLLTKVKASVAALQG